MKTYTIEISNIDYSGNDFCGEITSDAALRIYEQQPKVLLISFDAKDDEIEGCNDQLVDDVVFDYCYDNNILQPTSFDYLFVD